MAPAVEVLFAPATEAYRNDPTTLNPVAEIVAETKGALGIYHGLAIEDPTQLVVIIVWETLEAHQALINDKVKYPILGGHITKVAELSKLDMFHVYFEPAANLAVALNAPFTSFLKVESLKAGKTTADIQELLGRLTALPIIEGNHGGAAGKGVEKDEHVILLGWTDPKDHIPNVQKNGGDVLPKLLETIDQHKRGHVKFNVYRKYEA